MNWDPGNLTADRYLVGGGGVVPLPEIGCVLPLAEVYDGVAAAMTGG